MPAPVTDVATLQDYIEGVMSRADHHAKSVSEVALTLAGAIVWKKDADDIEVMAISGSMKNVLWVKIRGKRYAFSYNHATGQIEMRQGSTHGALLHAFDNTTPPSAVLSTFDAL